MMGVNWGGKTTISRSSTFVCSGGLFDAQKQDFVPTIRENIFSNMRELVQTALQEDNIEPDERELMLQYGSPFIRQYADFFAVQDCLVPVWSLKIIQELYRYTPIIRNMP
jgi:hypothetical protein